VRKKRCLLIRLHMKNQPHLPHSLPADLRKALFSDASVKSLWDACTPLGRNEWICWVTSVNKAETRREHMARLCEASSVLLGGVSG
jgi:uncharacterized protein YdeI (YjbR/CyaY-like superfamily)